MNEGEANVKVSGLHSMLHWGVFDWRVEFRVKTMTAEGSVVGSGSGPTSPRSLSDLPRGARSRCGQGAAEPKAHAD